MINIALDTNIWIYLTKDTYFELWIKFKEMKENDLIMVIVNDIIVKEWQRNKKNTIKSLTESIENEYKSAKKLSNYLDGQFKEQYLQIITQYKDEENRIKIAKNRVQVIEDFMLSCKIIETTTTQKLFIAELAINKNAPFQNNKNNFNDALILRNICEFVGNENNHYVDLIYVSKNPEDFIDKTTREVHKDLFKDLQIIELKNVTELAVALNLAIEFIELIDEDYWLEHQIESLAMDELDRIRGK